MTQIELLNRLNDLVGECFIGRISQNDAKVGIRRAIEEYDDSAKNSVIDGIISESDKQRELREVSEYAFPELRQENIKDDKERTAVCPYCGNSTLLMKYDFEPQNECLNCKRRWAD